MFSADCDLSPKSDYKFLSPRSNGWRLMASPSMYICNVSLTISVKLISVFDELELTVDRHMCGKHDVVRHETKAQFSHAAANTAASSSGFLLAGRSHAWHRSLVRWGEWSIYYVMRNLARFSTVRFRKP